MEKKNDIPKVKTMAAKASSVNKKNVPPDTQLKVLNLSTDKVEDNTVVDVIKKPKPLGKIHSKHISKTYDLVNKESNLDIDSSHKNKSVVVEGQKVVGLEKKKRKRLGSSSNKTMNQIYPFLEERDSYTVYLLSKHILSMYANYNAEVPPVPSNSKENGINEPMISLYSNEIESIESRFDESMLSIVNSELRNKRMKRKEKDRGTRSLKSKMKLTNLVSFPVQNSESESKLPDNLKIKFKLNSQNIQNDSSMIELLSNSSEDDLDTSVVRMKLRMEHDYRNRCMNLSSRKKINTPNKNDTTPEDTDDRPRWIRSVDWKEKLMKYPPTTSWHHKPKNKNMYIKAPDSIKMDSKKNLTLIPFSKEWEDEVLKPKIVVKSKSVLRFEKKRKEIFKQWENYGGLLNEFMVMQDEDNGHSMNMKGLEKHIKNSKIKDVSNNNNNNNTDLNINPTIVMNVEVVMENKLDHGMDDEPVELELESQFDNSIPISKLPPSSSNKTNVIIPSRPISSAKQKKKLTTKSMATNKIKTFSIIHTTQTMNNNKDQRGNLKKEKFKESSVVTVGKKNSEPVNNNKMDLYSKTKKVLFIDTIMKPKVKPTKIIPKAFTAASRRMDYWKTIEVTQKFHKEKMKKLAINNEIQTLIKVKESQGKIEEIHDVLLQYANDPSLSLRTRQWIDELTKPKRKDIIVPGIKTEMKKSNQLSDGTSTTTSPRIDTKMISKKFKSETTPIGNKNTTKKMSEQIPSLSKSPRSTKSPQGSKTRSISESRIPNTNHGKSSLPPNTLISPNKPTTTNLPMSIIMKKIGNQSVVTKPEVVKKIGERETLGHLGGTVLQKKTSKSNTKVKKKPEKKIIKNLASSRTVLSMFDKIPAAYPLPLTEDEMYEAIRNPTYDFVYDEQGHKSDSNNSIGLHLKSSEKNLPNEKASKSKIKNKIKPIQNLPKYEIKPGVSKPQPKIRNLFTTSQHLNTKSFHSPKNSDVDGEFEHRVIKPEPGKSVIKPEPGKSVIKPEPGKSNLASSGQVGPKFIPRNIIHTVQVKLPLPKTTIKPIQPPAVIHHPPSPKGSEYPKSDIPPLVSLETTPKIPKPKPGWDVSRPRQSNFSIRIMNEPGPSNQIKELNKTIGKTYSTKKSSTTFPITKTNILQKNPIKLRVVPIGILKNSKESKRTVGIKQISKFPLIPKKSSKPSTAGPVGNKDKKKLRRKPTAPKPKIPISLRLYTPRSGTGRPRTSKKDKPSLSNIQRSKPHVTFKKLNNKYVKSTGKGLQIPSTSDQKKHNNKKIRPSSISSLSTKSKEKREEEEVVDTQDQDHSHHRHHRHHSRSPDPYWKYNTIETKPTTTKPEPTTDMIFSDDEYKAKFLAISALAEDNYSNASLQLSHDEEEDFPPMLGPKQKLVKKKTKKKKDEDEE